MTTPEHPSTPDAVRREGADRLRWSAAWDKPLDADASRAWMKLRERLDPLLESLDATGRLLPGPGADSPAVRSFLEAARASVLPTPPDEEAPADPAAEFARGASFGGCEIVSLAGRGGMGEVYEAIDRSLGEGAARRVALKILPSSSAHASTRSSLSDSLHRDVAALSRLAHPSIARLYRAGVDESPTGRERPYLVTEFVEGIPFLAFVSRGCEPRTAARRRLALELGERLAGAIAASHAQGVVHRDIKSSNVLVRADRSLAIVDFGIAALDEPDRDDRTIADRLTMQPDALGSLVAISPERARGRSSGPREDVWAMGALLFEAITGTRPVTLGELPILEALRRISDTPARPIRSVDAGVPRDLAVVIDRCLAFDPADRYPDAIAAHAELARVRDGFAPIARPIGAIGRAWRLARRHPLPSTLAAALALLLVSGAAVSTSLAIEAARARTVAEDREQLVRSVADGVLVEVAETLRSIPGATAARQRLLEIGLSYAEAVGDERTLAGDRDAALELARALFTLGELHRVQQPNPSADDLGRAAFERAAAVARIAAEASAAFDPEPLGLAVKAESRALDGSPDRTNAERLTEWERLAARARGILDREPLQPDALTGLHFSCLRIGDAARLAGDTARAAGYFAQSLDATRRLVEAVPDSAQAWFHRTSALNSSWWLLYTTAKEGSETRILALLDEMIASETREHALLPESRALANLLASRLLRTVIAIEFGLIDPAEAEAALAEGEERAVELSESEPDLGLLRRVRAEAHLRRGDGLEALSGRARVAGDAAEARRLATAAAAAFESCAAVQRDRIARREQVATNEDAMLAYAIERAKAMREAGR